MRGKEVNAGSLRALLLILALLAANLAAILLRHPERSAAQSKDPVAERAASFAESLAPGDPASLPQRRFVEARQDPAAALGMTEEPTP